ncbi:MAG TPA: hypothetical protein VKV26_02980 [Dehalococcoidia bacterium]|nr:hypothetical protein [Dehalococcoidia bacterium]
MAAVIGNLAASDDYLHPLGPESNFNESMYFNVFDREQRVGGFVRLGNRANEGYAEMTICLFLPDGRVLFQYRRPPIQNNDAFDAGGMRFEVIEPAQRLRTTYEGQVVELKDPLEMAEPSAAFHGNPRKQVKLELVHEAVGPMYGSAGHAEAGNVDPEKEFARAHYEQHMRAAGSLQVEDECYQIDGLGLRDHSWGPRYWQAIDSYRWLTCNFGPDFGLMGSIVWQDKAKGLVRQGGVVVRDGKLTNVRQIEIDTRFAENGLYHEGFTARLALEGGETLAVEGAVKSFIPLRNRREGMITHVGEGMTEYRCGTRLGYGLSEYLDQVR